MSPTLKPLTSGEPDEIDLELLALGAVDDPAARARIEAAARGPLADEAAELQEFQAFWAEHAPGLPQPEPKRASWWRPLVALAAALLVAAAVGLLWPPSQPGVRPMGGLPVDLQATRGTVRLEAPFRLAPGDDLHVAFEAPADGFVDVWTVQQDGQASVLAAGEPVERGRVFSLYGAARLDDYEGREWLVIQLVPEPRTQRAIEAHAEALLPEPKRHAGDRTWVLEITRWR